jgi:hypothetical protein
MKNQFFPSILQRNWQKLLEISRASCFLYVRALDSETLIHLITYPSILAFMLPPEQEICACQIWYQQQCRRPNLTTISTQQRCNHDDGSE